MLKGEHMAYSQEIKHIMDILEPVKAKEIRGKEPYIYQVNCYLGQRIDLGELSNKLLSIDSKPEKKPTATKYNIDGCRIDVRDVSSHAPVIVYLHKGAIGIYDEVCSILKKQNKQNPKKIEIDKNPLPDDIVELLSIDDIFLFDDEKDLKQYEEMARANSRTKEE